MRHVSFLALASIAALSAGALASVAGLGGPDNTVCRVGKLKGKDIVTPAGEKLGDVQETIVDLKSGAIAYLVVDFGKATGTKDTFHAVPWTSFTESKTPKTRANELVLTFDRAKLQAAPQFTKTDWPAMEGAWGTDIDKYFAQPRFNDADRIGRVDRPTEDPNKRAPMDAAMERPGMLRRASKVIGLAVQNRAGESLGEIEDLAVMPGRNRILYAAVATGGFLGMGEKLHAIPCHAFSFSPDGVGCVLDVDKERLKKAPSFDKSAWPLAADDRFTTDIDRFWERPATRPL